MTATNNRTIQQLHTITTQIMKKLFTLIAFVATLMPAVAQQVEFRYNGKALPDNATVTILAESDEWGSTSCATNPSNNTSLLTLYNAGTDATLSGTATINILSNTIGTPQVSWCMGGNCVLYDATVGKSHQKEFSFDSQSKDLKLDYDALMLENYQQGEIRTKMTVAVGDETRTVNIVFLYGGSANNQLWWGYYHDSDETSGLGTSTAETYDQAILISGDNNAVSGKAIKSVKFYLQNLNNMDKIILWISKKKLPTNVNNADYVQVLEKAQLNGNSQGEEIVLKQPFETTPGEDIYVGYSYTITALTTEADSYPIITGATGVVGGLYLRTSKQATSWMEASSYGNLALRVLLEGEFNENSVTPQDFREYQVLPGGVAEIPVTITNEGAAPVESISYTITTDGIEGDEQTLTLPQTITELGSTAKVNIPFAADATLGRVEKLLTITKVNGATNSAALPFAKGSIKTVEELKEFPRTVLIEEFTTEYCGYCPEAATTLNGTMTNYPELKERSAIICHHAGYYTDWLTIPASQSYEWLYGGGGTYAPAFMWDRYPYDGVTPVVSRPANVTACKGMIENRLAIPSMVAIDLNAKLNDAGDKVEVTVNAERAINFSDTPARITIFVTEDNIKARSQSGAGSGGFTHQHVARAVNSTWGEVLNWDNDKATYSYTFAIQSGWKKEDLKVVAFISGYDSTNPANCAVENAAAVTLGNAADAIATTIADGQVTEQTRYNAAGQQITTPQHGLNIVRFSDGHAVKVMVK